MINKCLIAVIVSILCSTYVSADICAIKEYKNGLLKIGFKKISAVDLAATELNKFAKDENDQCREKLIHEFRNYYYEAMSAYDKYSSMDEWANPIPAEKRRKIESSISKVGWSLKESEGAYYIGESGGWFEKRFASILTEPYRQYFNNRTKEIKEGFSEDAGLLISWEQLRKRIARWEQFLKSYPNFEETSEVQAYLNRYIGTFLSGMDNSKIYDLDTKKLTTEVRSAYEKYLKENKNSAYYVRVKDFYEMLKKNKFIVPEDSNEYLKKKGYETMLGKQPPAY